MNDKNVCSPVRTAFRDQANLCDTFGSEFTARVLRGVERVISENTRFGGQILNWQGDPGAAADALPLRAAGALHGLARSKLEPVLTEAYPPDPAANQGELENALKRAISLHDEELVSWLKRAPQTNEVGRSAALYAGLMTIAKRTELPMSIFEIGSSAGLNLILDRYAYELDSIRCGNLDSSLTLVPAWTGASLNGAFPEIIDRRGCDVSPIDASNEDEAGRLAAYIWPDQPDRIRNLELAVNLFRKDPPVIDQMDALNWVRKNITPTTEDNYTRVLFHSVVFSYLPEESRTAITEHMENAGANATENSPLAWLMFELDAHIQPKLKLRLWPGGHEEYLANADPHVWNIHWLQGNVT